MDNYWHINDNYKRSQDVLDFIAAQSELLSQQTDGLVLAKLIKKRFDSLAGMQAMITAMESNLSSFHNGGEDAGKLYGKITYEFFVTDKDGKYELSIFEISCNDEFPVDLRIEASIAEEARLQTRYTVESYDEFVGYFADILKAKKINYVIRKLKRIAETSKTGSVQ